MSNVVIYSTPNCPYCVMAKEYLSEKNIAFTDHNVGLDKTKAEEMVKKSGQMGVPVVDIDDNIVVGFNKPEINRLLGL